MSYRLDGHVCIQKLSHKSFFFLENINWKNRLNGMSGIFFGNRSKGNSLGGKKVVSYFV